MNVFKALLPIIALLAGAGVYLLTTASEDRQVVTEDTAEISHTMPSAGSDAHYRYILHFGVRRPLNGPAPAQIICGGFTDMLGLRMFDGRALLESALQKHGYSLAEIPIESYFELENPAETDDLLLHIIAEDPGLAAALAEVTPDVILATDLRYTNLMFRKRMKVVDGQIEKQRRLLKESETKDKEINQAILSDLLRVRAEREILYKELSSFQKYYFVGTQRETRNAR